MTDLEAHVNAEGRADLVKQVREKINELGISYIYYQFISVTGRIVGKGIPADHWEQIAERGFQLVYGSTANLFTDRHGAYIGYGPEASELVGIPDPETFVQIPWDKRVGRVFCTCFRNREEPENPGGHLTSDCRGNLRILHDEFQEKHGGMHLRAGTEPEMMWLKKGEDGLPDGGFSKPNCYHIDQFESLRPVFMQVIEYSRAMGLDMIQGDHEDAPGQLELNWTFDDVLRNSDRLDHLPADLRPGGARERPHRLLHVEALHGRLGVGLPPQHFALDRRRGQRQSARQTPTNRCRAWKAPSCLPQGRREPLHAGPQHRRAQARPGRPAVRRRRHGALGRFDLHRLLDRELLPASLGHRFLGAGLRRLGLSEPHLRLRISAPGRFEYRSVDSMVNPYLMGAALLKAFDDGIDARSRPGRAGRAQHLRSHGGRQAGQEAAHVARRGPRPLEQDEVIKAAMPDEMYRVFMHYKRDEWEKFNHTVTEWDLQTYWDCLP